MLEDFEAWYETNIPIHLPAGDSGPDFTGTCREGLGGLTWELVSRIEKWVAQRGNSNSGRFILHELRKTAVTEMLMLVHAMVDSRPAPRVWAGMINLQSETLVEAGTEGLAREPACVADISKFPHARTLASMPNEYQAQISVFRFIEFSMLWLTSPPFSLRSTLLLGKKP